MDVHESWTRVVAWCQEHAPDTARAIRPPADADVLKEAEQATSGAWPEDLRTWYALMDGTERTPAGHLLPFYRPLPLQSVMSRWLMRQEISSDMIAYSRTLGGIANGGYDITRLESQPAGTGAGIFLPSFVLIAEDRAGSALFVDARSGSLRGCVTEFMKGDADTWGPKWPSVTVMLADLAEGLWAGRPIGGWQPVVVEGRLDWEVAANP